MRYLNQTSNKVNALTVFLILLFHVAVHGAPHLLLTGVIILTICHIFYHLMTGRWLGGNS